MEITEEYKAAFATRISVADKVAFLKQPGVYPHFTENVQVKETHWSWLFFTRGWVYKLKKPVKTRDVDLTTLPARLRNCREEIRLNRRLAKIIYQEVVSIRITPSGQLSLKEKGEAVAFMVKMKRIPSEMLLDYFIAGRRRVPIAILYKPATLLAKFYISAIPVIQLFEDYQYHLINAIDRSFRGLTNPVLVSFLADVNYLHNVLKDFVAEHSDWLKQRVAAKRIVEAHGDLRPEHISVESYPVVIDCIEFSSELRIMDVAEDLAFLMTECELYGNYYVGSYFFKRYTDLSGDNPPHALIIFYKLKCAFVRAFLVSRHLTEPQPNLVEKWRNEVTRYLRIGKQYASFLGK